MLLPQRHRVLAEIRRENLCVSLRNLRASAVKVFLALLFVHYQDHKSAERLGTFAEISVSSAKLPSRSGNRINFNRINYFCNDFN